MRLLRKTFYSFSIYAVLIILIAIPLFYLIINKMFVNDVDDALYQRKNELVNKFNHTNARAINTWQDIDGNVSLSRFSGNLKNSVITANHFNAATSENEPYRQLTAPVTIKGQQYKIVLRMSLVDSEDLAEGIVITQAILLISLLAGLLLLNHYQSKRIWRPFYQTLAGLQRYELDKNQPISFSATTIKEFQDLNIAIKELINRNYEVFRQQKEFTENAAHELQTPLAIFQSKLDLLLQQENLNKDQAEIIHSLMEATRRMIKLNKNLLLLAKIENHQYMEIEAVYPAEVINKVLSQYADQIEAKSLTIEISADQEYMLEANPVLIEILINNLLSNAIRYNQNAGVIKISLQQGELHMINDGKALPLDAQKLFQRFHKGAAEKGNGLGLSIVKKIVELNNYHIEYLYNQEKHHFHLHFG